MKKFMEAMLILLAIAFFASCGETRPRYIKPIEDIKAKSEKQKAEKIKSEKKEDKDFNAVFEVAKYFSTKNYEGSIRLYAADDLIVPAKIAKPLEYLSPDGISYPALLMHEIRARHYAAFTVKLYQKIFNFTFWYDQGKAKKGLFVEKDLNQTEKQNLLWLESIVNLTTNVGGN